MHDGIAPGWRQTLDRHHAALVDELTSQLDSEIGSSVARAVAEERTQATDALARAVADERTQATDALARAVAEERARASEETRRRLSESLNQTLRRIRQTSAEHETLQLLLEDSGGWAERAVVLLIESNQARIAAWRGVLSEEKLREEEEDGTPIEMSEAAAIASCVESRDPVVALAAAGEVSPALASALSGAGDGKVYLFPVTVRRNTVAVMAACGDVTPAPIELLCEAAGMRLESFEAPDAAVAPDSPAVASAPLVQIAGASRDTARQTADAATIWTKLTAEEQALHLRAQRTARVRVAQMRISEFDALRRGVQTADIYGALRPSIDAAREEYRQAYLTKTPTMVDYLHLEMMRSLAHEDIRLLGKDYPGPIV